MTTPLISVVIPSFNSAFIKECVDSVLAQTFDNFELIIVDCSTDPFSLAALDRFDHPKIKVFRRPERHLPGSNRNFGIERGSAALVVCLDADDILEPTFLEEALFVISCIDFSMVGTSVRYFGRFEKPMKLDPFPTPELVAWGDAFVVSIVFRKELWSKLGGFRDNTLGRDHIPEDWDFYVRAVAAGATLYNRGSYGLRYRKHATSITAQPDMPSLEEIRERISARFDLNLSKPKKRTEPSPLETQSVVQKDGWKRLLSEDKQRPQTGLVILPEQINGIFFDRLKQAINRYAAITVLSTCQMEAYPAEFLSFLCEQKAELFSLPDFLPRRELWLEFVSYLSETRDIIDIVYGQNSFFIDALPSLAKLCPQGSLNYISRYALEPTLQRR